LTSDSGGASSMPGGTPLLTVRASTKPSGTPANKHKRAYVNTTCRQQGSPYL
jgi:hypothetical protein